MSIRAFLCWLLSAIGLVVGGCGGGVAATPAPPRAGILYGYYGSVEGQIAETADHVTLQWVTVWDRVLGNGMPAVKARLREARAANIPAVVLTVPGSYVSEDSVRAYFADLHTEGLIDSRIVALYPEDEPDLLRTEEQVVATNAMVRRVAAEFPLPPGVKLAVIYTSRGLWTGITSYDWIGFDDYPQGVNVLSNGTWSAMKARLRPEQGILLVPGAYQCADIDAFYEKAQADPQVVAIVPFIWFDAWDINSPGSRGLRSQPCRQSYIDAALRLKNAR